MYHYVYKTVNPLNGKFYIGKHSTNNLNKLYQGSGIWIKDCKKSKTHLITGIIQFCSSEQEAFKLEEKIVDIHLNNKLCKNMRNGGYGFRIGEYIGDKNPAKKPEIRKILSEQKKGKLNPMYGVSLHKGKPKSLEHKKKLSMLRKNNPKFSGINHSCYGKKLPKHKCQFCDIQASIGNINRWHNDNCKFKNI